jgi:TRAP-type uncharacterized transport system substrate-binding protein
MPISNEELIMEEKKKKILRRDKSSIFKFFRPGFNKIKVIFAETFGLGPAVALSAVIFAALVIIIAAFLFFYFEPPNTIIITSGDEGSVFQRNSEKYAKILARNGVKVKIIKSEGSLQNLERLENPSFHVDVGFVQTGVAKGKNTDNLVSLGSISYEPLFIFYRGSKPLDMLSQFEGKRLAVGEDGTGTQVLALNLLAMNGIKPGGKTQLFEMDDDEAKKELLTGEIDAAFMMSDSASTKTMRELMRQPGIRLFDFSQADAYTRRIHYLNKIILPKGALDLGKNIPDRDINLLSPTVELIARSSLHPALSDLLMEAATEIHSRPTIMNKRGEFPALLEHEYRISADAARFYKSGKRFLYKYLPFWPASVINRIMVIFVPMLLILIPGLKSIPSIYRWRMRLRILRWYRALLVLEEGITAQMTPEKRKELIERLDQIEQTVNTMKMPASFADQFYSLRSHIFIVRGRLTSIVN